jgi:hypothetical protein
MPANQQHVTALCFLQRIGRREKPAEIFERWVGLRERERRNTAPQRLVICIRVMRQKTSSQKIAGIALLTATVQVLKAQEKRVLIFVT